MKTQIAIYEDHHNFREALTVLLSAEPEFEVILARANCFNLADEIIDYMPKIVLMDIDLPEIDGIEGVKKIKEVAPEISIIMLTVFEDDDKIFRAIQAGADGYLLKNAVGTPLINAIKDTANGGSSISPGIASKVLQAFRQKFEQPNFGLSQREQQVLELLVSGLSYKLIADETNVSIDTIRSHIKNIYIKLQVNSATEAVSKALRYKIVN